VVIGLASAFYFWSPDWGLFNTSDKTEKWITLFDLIANEKKTLSLKLKNREIKQ
jgi:hypothetical protein